MAAEVCEEYRSSLEDLTFNSKPLINVLTMLAEENIQHAQQIVQIIETHLRKVKAEHKLPVIYLIDSIIKNIGKNYLSLFRQNIVSNFCSVFEKGDEKVRMLLFKLRQTWSEVFSPQKLNAIDLRVKQLDPAWPIVEPTRPIVHVNPKFLENSVESVSPKKEPAPKPSESVKSHVALEAEMREKLKEKQQELLRLQQQTLELEYLKTKAQLEEQTRKLREVQNQQLQKQTGPMIPLAGGVTMPNAPQTNVLINQSTTKHPVNVQPSTRDPRLNANSAAIRDPRIYAKLTPNSDNVKSNSDQSYRPTANNVQKCPSSSIGKNDNSNSLKKNVSKRPHSPPAPKISHEKSSSPRRRDQGSSTKKQKSSSKSSKDSPKSKKTRASSSKTDQKKMESRKADEKVAKEAGDAQLRLSTTKPRSHSPGSKKEKQKKSIGKDKESDEKPAKENLKVGDVDLRTLSAAMLKRKSDTVTSEPPIKESKKDNSFNDLLGGGLDQDYRSPMPPNNGTPTNKKGWAKYKDEHTDHFCSPRKRSSSNSSDRSFTMGKLDTDLRNLQEQSEEVKTPSRSKLESSVQMAVMVKNKAAILKEAEEQLRSGQINEKQFDEFQASLGEVVKFQDERKKQLHAKDRMKNCKRKIMIDNKMREIRFENGCGIVTMDNHSDHLIFFKGKGRNVTINNQKIFLNFNGERSTFQIKGKEHAVMFGGPTRELFVDDIPYEGRFGGPPVGVTIDGKVYKAQLEGPPPDVDVKPLQNRDLHSGALKPHLVEPESSTKQDSITRDRNLRSKPLRDQFQGAASSKKGPPDDGRWKGSAPKYNQEGDERVPRLPDIPIEPLFPIVSDRMDQVQKSDRRRGNRHDNFDDGFGPGNSRSRNNDFNRKSPPGRTYNDRITRFNVPRNRLDDFQSDMGKGKGRNDKARIIKWNRPEELTEEDYLLDPTVEPKRDDNFLKGGRSRGNNNQSRNKSFQNQRFNRENRNDRQDSVRGGRERDRNVAKNSSRKSPNRLDDKKSNSGSKSQPIPSLMPLPSSIQLPPDQQLNLNAAVSVAPELLGVTDAENKPNSLLPTPANLLSLPTNVTVPLPQPNIILPQPNVILPPPSLSHMALNPPPAFLAQPPPSVVNPLLSLNVSSLFEKLVSTGIISKSESGAGYNVATRQPQQADEQSKLQVEKIKENNGTMDGEESVDIPQIELHSSALRQNYPGVIKLLYMGTKCESCGVRFHADNMDKYGQHLDWHFRSNRREKDGAKKANSRKWYYEVEDWIQFEEIEDLEERAQNYFEVQAAEELGTKAVEANSYSVPVSEDNNQNICTVCGEEFEHFWDEDEESWHLKDAIRVAEKAYHPSCYEDSQPRETTNFLGSSDINVIPTGALPGLDLLEVDEEKEPESQEDVKIDVKEEPKEEDDIKKEPVDSEEPVVDAEQQPIDNIKIKEEPLSDSETTEGAKETEAGQIEIGTQKIRIKEEPMDVNVSDETKTDDLSCKNTESENETPTTPLIDGTGDAPTTPLVDEKPEIIVRPEPERIRIAPQTGSAISLNLCKSTVDSGLLPGPEDKVPSVEAPPASHTEDAENEEELVLPPPDPRFDIQEPVLRGTELSGLCSIM